MAQAEQFHCCFVSPDFVLCWVFFLGIWLEIFTTEVATVDDVEDDVEDYDDDVEEIFTTGIGEVDDAAWTIFTEVVENDDDGYLQ